MSDTASCQTFAGRVALIAPAAAIAVEALEATYARLTALGINYLPGAYVQARHRYLAGTLEERLTDLYTAYENPETTAVWCLRGGYGCAHLLPHIDWQRLRRVTPKPLIGFSDISVLLSDFHRHGLTGIHGPVATAWARSYDEAEQQEIHEASLFSLLDLLKEQLHTLPTRQLSGPKDAIRGPLIGGNLTALASVAGTAHGLYVPPRSILILEDVGEPYYRIERSLWQLLHSIDRHQLGAVCLGTFTDCPRKGVAHSIEEIVAEWLAPWDIPLYAGLPSGHGPANRAWPYGRDATISATELRWA
ncbi:muramoyltetrapeptide carboxypeptidase [Pseudomonas duriflava]|uniref:Muramoyltetrapeptide carboxypeptidase n=1 Tax=Pseudomonas duriflava TaxID=459528 RepID=A0A562QM77_9PSED|nr:LD-carboxypeptidase [Pseudomonas duriflava]TWI57300.1 muramoyltetrapeptide carboxypeptidase [Pseudomonas duriflava]